MKVETSYSFPEFIRMGWKLPDAGTPFTTWQLDNPQPMESRCGWPGAGIGVCWMTGYPIGKLLTALQKGWHWIRMITMIHKTTKCNRYSGKIKSTRSSLDEKITIWFKKKKKHLKRRSKHCSLYQDGKKQDVYGDAGSQKPISLCIV